MSDDGRRFSIELLAFVMGFVMWILIVSKLGHYMPSGGLAVLIGFVIWALCYFAVRSVIMSVIEENSSQPECNGEGNSQRSDAK